MTAQLSVVVARRGRGSPVPAVAALRESCRGLDAEILVVAPADDREGSAEVVPLEGVQWLAAQGQLVPELWAAGLRAARGVVVAFSTSDMVVERTWGPALVGAIREGAAGAGGAIALAANAPAYVRASYYLRFAAFAPPIAAGPVTDIPGDNSAYSRRVLDRHADEFGAGFWEHEFHRRLPPGDRRLVLVPGATATYWNGPPVARFTVQRFRHGRHFGAYRVRRCGMSRSRIIAAAPLVPLVSLARITRHLWARRRAVGPLLTALPALVPPALAWALGEAVGAATSRAPVVEERT